MTAKIFIGYSTRPVEDVQALAPVFEHDRRLTDKGKIEADLAFKREAWLAEAKDLPYTGTFQSVLVYDNAEEKLVRYDHHPPESGKRPVSVRVRDYLLKNYPKAWPDDTHPARGLKVPEAIFVGFNPRRFLKILGLECSLPAIGKPLPLKLWYSNSDHRDIAEAVLPADCKKVDLLTAVRCRRPVDPADRAKWDAIVGDWAGPGVDPEKDVLLTIMLATQLGIKN